MLLCAVQVNSDIYDMHMSNNQLLNFFYFVHLKEKRDPYQSSQKSVIDTDACDLHLSTLFYDFFLLAIFR